MTVTEIERFLRAFWQCDWDICSSMLALDAVYEDPLLDEPVRGRSDILDVFRFCHAWAALDPRLRTLFGDGQQFCAELRVVGTVIAAADGIPESSVGRGFDFAEADVFQVNDGQIVRMSVYADVVGFHRQIGAHQS